MNIIVYPLVTFLILFLILLIILLKNLSSKLEEKKEIIEILQSDYNKLLSQKKSSEVKLGQISEHLVPFLDSFPYDPKDAKFLGEPIDYLIYDLDNDKIVFLEIKTGGSQLSSKQRKIRDLIKEGKIFWEIIRLN
jgi:predicted Holliday junction resolvase-like endonuclease